MSINATGNAETTVSTSTEGNRGLPSVALLGDGGWIVTWFAAAQDNGSRGVYQQRFDSAGKSVGVETRVNTTSDGDQSDPQVTVLADGGWVVTWHSDVGDTEGFGIFQQRYDSAGVAVGREILLNSVSAGNQLAPRITALGDGGWLVAWNSDGVEQADPDGEEYLGSAVVQRRYGADGEPAGIETQVNTFTTGTQYTDSLARLEDGDWVVTWNSPQEADDATGIYQQRYDADGNAVGAETHVNTYAAGAKDYSTAVGLADGGWVVVWQSSGGQDGSSSGIFQQRFDGEGEKVGGETQVNTQATGFQGSPTIEAMADGGWIAAWTCSDRHGVYIQRYDAAGAPVGEETQINISSGYHSSPDITAFDDGSFLMTWHWLDAGGSTGSIKQRYFAADVAGSDEAETLTGTLWNERLTGLAGTDKLVGGLGQDVLAGGLDADSFVFGKGDTGKTRATADTIEDFSRRQHDEIDLSLIDANVLRGRNNAFDFIAARDFSRTAGELRYEKRGDETYVYGDTDGNGKADIVIHLDGTMKLREIDFEL